MRVTVSAPGKLVLLGEYAVLFGHPAMVMAVDCRARVDLRSGDGPGWRVSAPGFCDEGAFFDLYPDRGFAWCAPGSEAADRLVLVERVLGPLVTEGFIDPRGLPPATITLDTGEFFLPADGGRAKLGLGSSAALTVALVEAVRRWSPDDRRRQPLDLAELLAFHRSFQGGRGSGIDLAASTSGGVVEYRLIGEASNPDARPIDLPSTLEIVPVFTGRSTSTSVFLARLYEGLQSDGGAIEVALERLGRDSAAGIVHLKSGNTAAFLEGIDAFAASMRNLGRVTGIPVVSDEHIRLGEIAAEIGVRYKPSGAGGGDVGLGFTNDPDAAAAFARQATAAGFAPLDLHIDPDGVRTDP